MTREVTADDKAVFELKVQRDKIAQQAKKMQKAAEKDKAQAQQCAARPSVRVLAGVSCSLHGAVRRFE